MAIFMKIAADIAFNLKRNNRNQYGFGKPTVLGRYEKNSFRDNIPGVSTVLKTLAKAMEQVYLIAGILLLLLMLYDFFFTTLSGSGSGFLTHLALGIASVSLHLGFRLFGRKFFGFSGMLVNLVVLAMWVLLAWGGLFLIYSSDPAAITDSNGIPADVFDRLYFTGYTLSTLGNGDLQPVTPIFKLVTSLCSFFGFVIFTTSISYLLSVSSSVINKRNMALFIRTMGSTPEEIARSLESDLQVENYTKLSRLEEMLHKYTVTNHAYPVLHYYHNINVYNSLGLNLATFDEGLNMLLTKDLSDKTLSYLVPLRKAFDNFLRYLENTSSMNINFSSDQLPPVEGNMQKLYPEEMDIAHRRRLLSILLKNERFSWQDVYQSG